MGEGGAKTEVDRYGNIYSAVNLKAIWPRRGPKARAVHAAGGLGAFF